MIKKILKKYKKAVFDMIIVVKQLGLSYKIIREPDNSLSLYIFNIDKNGKFVRVPVKINNKNDLKYYEFARKKLLILKKEKKSIQILNKIKTDLDRIKKEAEVKYIASLKETELKIYFDWKCEQNNI